MNLKKNKSVISILLFILVTAGIYSQSKVAGQTINYFGVLSTDLDSNMSKMTSDLYYTQLCELTNITVNDCRNEASSITSEDQLTLSDENLNFYFKVSKTDESKWISSLFLVNKKTLKITSESKEYDSFYKILMEPKNTLQENLKKLYENYLSGSVSNITANLKDDSKFPDFSKLPKIFSTEELSGTWNGESYIDKIVIMRGGRGFVIFNNGASMNISIKIDNAENKDSIIITQTSRTNASFYPNIDRKIALAAAYDANPIEWTLKLIDSNTLQGTKRTLIPAEDGNVVEGLESVTWSKKS